MAFWAIAWVRSRDIFISRIFLQFVMVLILMKGVAILSCFNNIIRNSRTPSGLLQHCSLALPYSTDFAPTRRGTDTCASPPLPHPPTFLDLPLLVVVSIVADPHKQPT